MSSRARQSEAVAESQREQFRDADAEHGGRADRRRAEAAQATSTVDEQAVALRDAMRVLFPEAIALVSAARARASCARAGRAGLPAAMSLLDRAIVRTLPAVPRPVVKRLSSRYIAGPELRDAVRVVQELNTAGKMAALDVLGEEVHNRNEALALVDEYRAVFDAISREELDTNVSVKPTGLQAHHRPRVLWRPRPARPVCRGALELRPDRHGGLVGDLRNPRGLPRAAGGGARQRRHRAPVAAP